MRQFDPWDKNWDPVPEGTIRLIKPRNQEDQTVTWEIALRWLNGGWTQIVGLRMGDVHAGGLPLRVAHATGPGDILSPPGTEPLALPALHPQAMARMAADAERHRQDYDTTQRLAIVRRDIRNGVLLGPLPPTSLGGREFEMLRNKAGVHDAVRLAASLYRFFLDIGSNSPTEDVAEAMELSRATAARRIQEARRAGMLGPARPGTSGEYQPTRRGK